MKLKVCGMRNASNIKELLAVKPDFIGFIFHEKSPRNVVEIPNISIPENLQKVGVFVNKPMDFIQNKIRELQLDYVQLHGKETPEFCKNLQEKSIKTIKAFNIHKNFDFNELDNYNTYCEYFLFDASGEFAGGNGVTFNWNLLKKYKGKIPFLLSGGIDDTMVSEIKKITHQMFAGIDINSGFEIKPAVKDIQKIKNFKEQLNQ